MGFQDIVYDLFKEFRSAKADTQKKKEIARQLVKKALLQFNFEWDSFRKSGIHSEKVGKKEIGVQQQIQC